MNFAEDEDMLMRHNLIINSPMAERRFECEPNEVATNTMYPADGEKEATIVDLWLRGIHIVQMSWKMTVL